MDEETINKQGMRSRWKQKNYTRSENLVKTQYKHEEWEVDKGIKNTYGMRGV